MSIESHLRDNFCIPIFFINIISTSKASYSTWLLFGLKENLRDFSTKTPSGPSKITSEKTQMNNSFELCLLFEVSSAIKCINTYALIDPKIDRWIPIVLIIYMILLHHLEKKKLKSYHIWKKGNNIFEW